MLGLTLMCFVTSCGVYSFTGAAIEGRTINVHFIENNARTVVPSLSATLTEKLRQRILSQSSLSQVNNDMTDYDVSGAINGYDVTVASVTGKETSLLNRLTITVSITFKNKMGNTGIVKNDANEQLGASFHELSKAECKQWGVRGGVQVSSIQSGGVLAKQTRIKKTFVITQVNDDTITTLEDLNKVISSGDGDYQLGGIYPNIQGVYYYIVRLN